MDLVVEGRTYDGYKMGAKKGRKKGHRNCIQHIYSKILNEKTIIKDDGGQSKNKKAEASKTLAAANGATNYRRAKPCTTSQNKSEGMNLVSSGPGGRKRNKLTKL
jgi:hypothetical protein